MLTALSLLAAEGPAQPVDPGGGSSMVIPGMLVVAGIAAVGVLGLGLFVIVRAAIVSAEKKTRHQP